MPVQITTRVQREAAILLFILMAIPPPCPLDSGNALLCLFVLLVMRPPEPLLDIRRRLLGNRQNIWRGRDLFAEYAAHPHEFFLVTSETLDSFNDMLTMLQRYKSFRDRGISIENKLMMVLMWLRTYPSYATLSLMFDVSRSTVFNIIHSMIQPLHDLYAGGVRWPTVAEWVSFGGKWHDMPSVVGMIDATSHRIYRPKTERETLYYSGHRHFHCVHTQIIVDNNGVLRYIKSGFKGHNNDATTFRQLPAIGPNEELDFPPNHYLLADKIYPSRYPLITPFSAAQILRRPLQERAVCRRFNRKLSKRRMIVEHTIRNVKLFRVIGTLYRHPRRTVVTIVELCAGLSYRRAVLLSTL